MDKLKQEFFDAFADGVDAENDYYDSQFEGQKPYRVWSWIANKISQLESLVSLQTTVKEKKVMIRFFTVGLNETERINEGLEDRGVTAKNITTIIKTDIAYEVWYMETEDAK